MRKMSGVKFGIHGESRPFESKVLSKARLNLNDLLSRRKEEKQVEKKTNFLIFSSATGAAALIFLILLTSCWKVGP